MIKNSTILGLMAFAIMGNNQSTFYDMDYSQIHKKVTGGKRSRFSGVIKQKREAKRLRNINRR